MVINLSIIIQGKKMNILEQILTFTGSSVVSGITWDVLKKFGIRVCLKTITNYTICTK